MRIQLANLEFSPPRHRSREALTQTLAGRNSPLTHVHHDLPGSVYHRGFLETLSIAYNHHCGVALTPDTIWFALLTQLAVLVQRSPERFRSLFTRAAEKVEILVDQGDDERILPIDAVIRELEEKSPLDPERFLPTFSTTGARERLAFMAAFLDLVSPFYSYGIQLCGLPFVEVLGTKADWQLVVDRWRAIAVALTTTAPEPRWTGYAARVDVRLEAIVNQFDAPNPAFWEAIFKAERCGSGSQQLINGWYTELYFEQPSFALVNNFASQLAKVDYKNYATNRSFTAFYGQLSSQIEDHCLRPEFGYVIFERPEHPAST